MLTPAVLSEIEAAVADAEREPLRIFFDPAVYAGDAETDLAMSELFGGSYARQAEGLISLLERESFS